MKADKLFIVMTVFSIMAVHLPSASASDCSEKVVKRIKKLHKTAMEDYDQMEFASARKTLQDAIAIARREGCDESIAYANVLVDLGIVYITDTDNPDETRGRMMFRKALSVNACAEITKALRTPKLQKILDEERKKSGVKCKAGGSTAKDPDPEKPPVKVNKPDETSDVDNGPEPQKIEHSVPDDTMGGKKLVLKCRAPKAGVSKVAIYYRKPGQSDYTAAVMQNTTGYTWKVEIPAADVSGAVFQYYIAAISNGGKPIMAHGNSGAPNIISITKPKGGSGPEDEDPLGKKDPKKDNGTTAPVSTHPKLMFKIGGRYGAGYLSTSMCSYYHTPSAGGSTDCDSGVHVAQAGFGAGELGAEAGFHYFISKSFSLGLDVKFGIVNYSGVDDDSNPATSGVSGSWYGFSGLGKALYYPLTDSAFMPYVGGVLGGGQMWHAWEVDQTNGVTDIFGHGFVMAGGSIGFLVGSPRVAFYLNIDAIFIFPEQSTFHVDFSAGLALRF